MSKTGGTWTSQLYFDPEASVHPDKKHWIADDEIGQTDLFPKEEVIREVKLYQGTRCHDSWFESLLRRKSDNHLFIILKAGRKWWSFELTDHGISIQNSKSDGQLLKGCMLSVSRKCSRNIGDLLMWIQGNCANWRPDGKYNNCHDFAVKLFNFISKGEESPEKSDTLCGEKWKPRSNGSDKYEIHYIPISKYWIDSDQLSDELKKLIIFETPIEKVFGYWKPLSEYQLTALIAYHRYIVFQTADGYWWSIEKNDEGLTMQRGKTCAEVRDNRRQEPRLEGLHKGRWKPKCDICDISKKTMGQLVSWLEGTDMLNRPYCWITNNCQHFGNNVFNFLATVGRLRRLKYDG